MLLLLFFFFFFFFSPCEIGFVDKTRPERQGGEPFR